MKYLSFSSFDPISEIVPSYPFPLLPVIAARARNLLMSRSAEEIFSIDDSISCVLDEYFKRVKEDEIKSLEETGDEYFCIYEKDDSGPGRYRFNQELENELDIPIPETTSEVDALKECIESITELGLSDQYDPEVKPCQFFAVLSLRLIGDTLCWLHLTQRNILKERPAETAETLRNLGPYIDAALEADEQGQPRPTAADSAIKAMDAVCYAEHLEEEDRWSSYSGASFRYALESQKTELEAAARADVKEAYASGGAFAYELFEKDLADKKASYARQLNEKRHAGRNVARTLVCNEWGKNPSAFPSAEKAGEYFADWLKKKGHTFEPRTVRDWIRRHARDIGKKLR